MSYISADEYRELAKIRHRMTEMRTEIFNTMTSMKIIGKKQCQQWIDQLCDVAIAADTPPVKPQVNSKPFGNRTQPMINLVDIKYTMDIEELLKKGNQMTVEDMDSIDDDNRGTEVLINDSPSTSISDNSERENQPIEGKQEVRYKGVIRTIADTVRPPKRTVKSNNQTKSKKNKKNENSSDQVFQSAGKVLGGTSEATVSTDNMTNDEMRELRLKKTEERMAMQQNKGVKGEIKLTHTRATADLPTETTNSVLKWTV